MTTKLDKAMEKLWPTLSYPLTYTEVLGTLSKQQLTAIRTKLQISNLSTLNKQGLVEKLSEKIPENIQMVIRCFDHNRLKLLQKIVKNEGMWDKPLLELQQYRYFRERGILFPATVDGKQVVMMPVELLDYLKSEDLLKDSPIITRNTEWIRLTKGLLYYYGTLTVDRLKSFVITDNDHPLAQYDIMNILFEAQDYYEQFFVDEDANITDFRVVDLQDLLKEQALRNDLDYCPFTKQQLLKAGEAEYVERNNHYMRLLRFVLERYEIDREDADLMVEECTDAARNGNSLDSVIKLAQDYIDIPNVQTMQLLTELMVPLLNNTKQWALKGYAPSELSAKRASASLVLNHTSSSAAQADVIDIHSNKKVGRNDPCPCGSGKKFKKCCG